MSTTNEKYKGNVKWFSVISGYGFIAPSSENAPTKDDIFVHRTAIVSDGYTRRLTDGYEVEFELGKDAAGKLVCQNVTAPGGTPIPSPPKRTDAGGEGDKNDGEKADGQPPANGNNNNGNQRRRRRGRGGGNRGGGGGGEGNNGKENNDGKDNNGENGTTNNAAANDGGKETETPKPQPAPGRPLRGPWHEDKIADNVKEMVAARGISVSKTTVDVASGDARIKISTGGYCACAHASGTLAEGLYTIDDQGLVTFDWKHVLVFSDGEWKSSDAGSLPKSMEWKDESLGPVKEGETTKMLWGDDKNDPTRALLEKNEFQMRRVILERSAAPNRGRNRNGRRGGGRGGGGRGGGRGDGGGDGGRGGGGGDA